MNAIEKEVLRAQLAVEGGRISKEELARKAGLRGSTLTGMLSPNWNPTRTTISRVIDVLNRIDAEAQQVKAPGKALKKAR